MAKHHIQALQLNAFRIRHPEAGPYQDYDRLPVSERLIVSYQGSKTHPCVEKKRKGSFGTKFLLLGRGEVREQGLQNEVQDSEGFEDKDKGDSNAADSPDKSGREDARDPVQALSGAEDGMPRDVAPLLPKRGAGTGYTLMDPDGTPISTQPAATQGKC